MGAKRPNVVNREASHLPFVSDGGFACSANFGQQRRQLDRPVPRRGQLRPLAEQAVLFAPWLSEFGHESRSTGSFGTVTHPTTVKRGNRRHRKMQKTVCRARTRQTISRRSAGDMLRDLQAPARCHSTFSLHRLLREAG